MRLSRFTKPHTGVALIDAIGAKHHVNRIPDPDTKGTIEDWVKSLLVRERRRSKKPNPHRYREQTDGN